MAPSQSSLSRPGLSPKQLKGWGKTWAPEPAEGGCAHPEQDGISSELDNGTEPKIHSVKFRQTPWKVPHFMGKTRAWFAKRGVPGQAAGW